MKLDKDLVRKILLAIEADESPPLGLIELTIEGYSTEIVSYHVEILNEADLIEGRDLTSFDGYHWAPTRLTYSGHEFLDSIRDNEIWRLTKEGAKKAGQASIGFIWELAKAYGKQALKDRVGIDLG